MLTDCYLNDPSVGLVEAVRAFRNSDGWVSGYGTEYGPGNGGVDFTKPASDEGNAALAKDRLEDAVRFAPQNQGARKRLQALQGH